MKIGFTRSAMAALAITGFSQAASASLGRASSTVTIDPDQIYKSEFTMLDMDCFIDGRDKKAYCFGINTVGGPDLNLGNDSDDAALAYIRRQIHKYLLQIENKPPAP